MKPEDVIESYNLMRKLRYRAASYKWANKVFYEMESTPDEDATDIAEAVETQFYL